MNGRGTLLIVGNVGGTNVGESFRRAGQALGLQVIYLDTALAQSSNIWVRRLWWHLLGRRPSRLGAFGERLVEQARQVRPAWLLTSGWSPVSAAVLEEAGRLGIKRLHYSTDDPWNPGQKARWFLETLPCYDAVFSTRRANLADLRALGCREVHYLPFAYDPGLAMPAEPARAGDGLVFVGGGDADRARMLAPLVTAGLPLSIHGSGWPDRGPLSSCVRGRVEPVALRAVTRAAAVNLCLVRRANRDGHVMRSFEIPAQGGCMLAEDTQEHRDILGDEGECTLFFRDTNEMIAKARFLLDRPSERLRLARAAHARIVSGHNTYQDRLARMLDPSP